MSLESERGGDASRSLLDHTAQGGQVHFRDLEIEPFALKWSRKMSEHSLEIREPVSVFQRLKAEFLSLLPVTVFFFLAYNVINITHALFFHKQHIPVYREVDLLIMAAVAGKVLAVLDLLPFLNVFHGKPLVYTTLWKTSIYSIGALLFHYGHRLEPFILKYKDLGLAIRQWILQEDWYQFWGAQLWAFVILLVYQVAKQTIEEVGAARMRRLFFGF